MIRAFRKIRSKVQDLVQVQENIEQTFKSVLQVPLLNGRLITDLALVTGSINRVEHKLGRKFIGYLVVRKNAAATIYDSKSSNVADEGVLLLSTDTNTTIDIWIF